MMLPKMKKYLKTVLLKSTNLFHKSLILNKILMAQNYCRLFLAQSCQLKKILTAKESQKWYSWKTEAWSCSSKIEEQLHGYYSQFSKDVVVVWVEMQKGCDQYLS